MRIPTLPIPNAAVSAFNWLRGKRQPTTAERIVNVVTTIAKIILCGLAASGVAYGTGVLMMHAGICLQTSPTFAALPFRYCGTALVKSGTAIAAFGHVLFLGITSPIKATLISPFTNASLSHITAKIAAVAGTALVGVTSGFSYLQNSVAMPFINAVTKNFIATHNLIHSSVKAAFAAAMLAITKMMK